MKKIIYTILSICAIIYIAFLSVDILIENTDWSPNMQGFTSWFNFIVDFGGVAIIFCFALVNFTGNPLKLVFFTLLIVAILVYIVIAIMPDWLFNLFRSGDEEVVEECLRFVLRI